MNAISLDFHETLIKISDAYKRGKNVDFVIRGRGYDVICDEWVDQEFHYNSFDCTALKMMREPCGQVGVGIMFSGDSPEMTFVWMLEDENIQKCPLRGICTCATDVIYVFNRRVEFGKPTNTLMYHWEDPVEAIDRGRRISKRWKVRKGLDGFNVVDMSKRNFILREFKIQTSF